MTSADAWSELSWRSGDGVFDDPLWTHYRGDAMTIRRRRSALYVPAANARAIDKARSLPCDAAFTPDATAVEAAQRIVAAFAPPENAGKGALRVDGQMVERLHLAQARRTLAMAGVDAAD